MRKILTIIGLLSIASTSVMAEVSVLEGACTLSVQSMASGVVEETLTLKDEHGSMGTESFGVSSSDGKVHGRVRTMKNKNNKAVMSIYIGEAKQSQVMDVPGHGEMMTSLDGKNYILSCDINN